MNYQDTVNWMFHQLPMYQNKGKSAYKADLSNTILLANHLNNPEKKFKAVHVAGTNGKGSTSHMIASILQEAGYKVGLYTSPHLKDYRERIKINGEPVSKQFVIQFIKRNRSFFEENRLSFFEMTVGLAFDYFSKKKVDIAIIEVGLGGRLDSTNIITPELSVITNIGFDHMQFLGDTLELIAKEKAGIIKPNVPVVIGETQNETSRVFRQIAESNNAKIVFADTDTTVADYDSDLKGSYQKLNRRTAIVAIETMIHLGYQIKEDHIRKGLLSVVKNTGILGRWQLLGEAPLIICDTAHNKEGLTYVLRQVQSQKKEVIHFVLGFVNDKKLETVIPLFPEDGTYYFCKPKVQRGMLAHDVQEQFSSFGIQGEYYESVSEAFETAKKNASENDLIYVGGSTFVVAEIL